jgi:hypothetical protein
MLESIAGGEVMNDRYVESKSLGVRIECDGPLDVQIAKHKLLEMGATDVELEFKKKPPTRARALPGHKRNRK